MRPTLRKIRILCTSVPSFPLGCLKKQCVLFKFRRFSVSRSQKLLLWFFLCPALLLHCCAENKGASVQVLCDAPSCPSESCIFLLDDFEVLFCPNSSLTELGELHPLRKQSPPRALMLPWLQRPHRCRWLCAVTWEMWKGLPDKLPLPYNPVCHPKSHHWRCDEGCRPLSWILWVWTKALLFTTCVTLRKLTFQCFGLLMFKLGIILGPISKGCHEKSMN